MMKKIIAIWMLATAFAACSGDEDSLTSNPSPNGKGNGQQTYTMTVQASKGGEGTRALSLDGKTLNATWAEGERVTVYNVTKGADLEGYLEAQSSGASTTLKGTLTGTIKNGDDLTLKFLSPSYGTQDGTLTGTATSIDKVCDYAEATVEVTNASTASVTTTDASFVNKQAIVKFTLKKKADNLDLEIPAATALTVNDGTNNYTVTPASATNELFVAIPATNTVNLSTTVNGIDYSYEKTGANLMAGKYYEITVKMMDDATLAMLSTPLTLEAVADGTTVTFKNNASGAVTYTVNGGSAQTIASGSTGNISANAGDKVSFFGDNATYTQNTANYIYGTFFVGRSTISCSADCYVYGNIMSLVSSTGFSTATELTSDFTFQALFYHRDNGKYIKNHATKRLVLPATTLTAHCYNGLFSNCSSLTVSPALPATTLAEGCYHQMFHKCTSLTAAPALPATTLAEQCYNMMFMECKNLSSAPALLPATTLTKRCYFRMFEECVRLTSAPALPATTLTEECYFKMFRNCGYLTSAPTLPATTLADHCYESMFSGCYYLSSAPALPATKLAKSCYNYMFENCRNLSTAPALPATTLAEYCYDHMFKDCDNLSSAPALPATTLAENCYCSMFEDCDNLSTAPALPATTLAENCYCSMFEDCPSLTTAPVLPATTLVDGCYNSMFKRCSSLNSVTCLATNFSAMYCTNDWLDSVAETGTFYKPADTEWEYGYSGIPWGWEVVDAN